MRHCERGVDASRQTCRVCGRPDKFNFYVPDEVWQEVVPAEFSSRVVCLYCFDGFAKERRVDYATRLSEVWFAGDAATFQFQVSRAIPSCQEQSLADLRRTKIGKRKPPSTGAA